MRASGQRVAVPPAVTQGPGLLNGVLCCIQHVAPTVTTLLGLEWQKGKHGGLHTGGGGGGLGWKRYAAAQSATGEDSVTWHTSLRGRLGSRAQEEDMEPR